MSRFLNSVVIDLSTGDVAKEKVRAESLLSDSGGFGFSYEYYKDSWIAALKNPEAANFITFDTGILTGSGAPGSGAWSVSYVSPLTGNLATESIEGEFGTKLKYSGIDHLCIKGKAKKPVYLLFDNGLVEIKEAKHLLELNTRDTIDSIKNECDDQDFEVLSTGPYSSFISGISCPILNYYYELGCQGLGDIFKQINVKAVVVNGSGKVDIAYSKKFLQNCMKVIKSTSKGVNEKKIGERCIARYLSPWNKDNFFFVNREKGVYVMEFKDYISNQIIEENILSKEDLKKLKYFSNLLGFTWNLVVSTIYNALKQRIEIKIKDIETTKDLTKLIYFLKSNIPECNYKKIKQEEEQPEKIAIESSGLKWDQRFLHPNKSDYAASFLSFMSGKNWNRFIIEEAGRQIIDTRRHILSRGGVK